MFEKWEIGKTPHCPDCHMDFNDMFEAINHFLEDDEDFDPALILPGGYQLMIGSLLRALFEHRNEPKFISDIVQSTYATLFMAEMNPELVNETVEDMIVDSEMIDFDVQLKNLFKNGE
jgi:hypothetical protein